MLQESKIQAKPGSAAVGVGVRNNMGDRPYRQMIRSRTALLLNVRCCWLIYTKVLP